MKKNAPHDELCISLYNMREMLNQSLAQTESFRNFQNQYKCFHERFLNEFNLQLNDIFGGNDALPADYYFKQRFVKAIKSLAEGNINVLETLLNEPKSKELRTCLDYYILSLSMVNKDFINYCTSMNTEQENDSGLKNRLAKFLVVKPKSKAQDLSNFTYYGTSQNGRREKITSMSQSMMNLPSLEELIAQKEEQERARAIVKRQ